jgi:hypothetical protein
MPRYENFLKLRRFAVVSITKARLKIPAPFFHFFEQLSVQFNVPTIARSYQGVPCSTSSAGELSNTSIAVKFKTNLEHVHILSPTRLNFHLSIHYPAPVLTLHITQLTLRSSVSHFDMSFENLQSTSLPGQN